MHTRPRTSSCYSRIFLQNHNSKHIQFGVLSPQEIVNVSEFEVTQRDLYTVENRQPVKYGMLDLRLVRLLSTLSCSSITSPKAYAAARFQGGALPQ